MLSQPFAALARFDRMELRYLLLTVILCVMLGGLFPALVANYGHAVDYGVWLGLWVLLGTFWMELPMFRLLRPAAPLVIWLMLYICWGTLAAPYPIFDEGYRLAFRFCSVAAAMTVVTSRPGRLRVFANAAQWVLVINLAVTVLLMVRPEYQGLMAFSGLDIDAESDRFAGMWGNANQAGLVSLMVLVLSRWASRWHGRIGRLCGLTIIYLTASRTATWILVTLLVLYLGFAASRKVRLNALALALTLAAGAFFALRVTGNSLESLAAGNPNIARVLDVTEAKNEEAGMGSRRQVFVKWLGMVPSEPWYGFGLYTLNGGDSPEAPVRPELPSYGPHNLYLGIVLDVGWVGLASFLGVILYQLMVIRRTWLVPASRHAMFALCLVVLVFSNFNHNMLTEYAGWIGFSLMFLLPSSPALEGQRYGDPTIDRR